MPITKKKETAEASYSNIDTAQPQPEKANIKIEHPNPEPENEPEKAKESLRKDEQKPSAATLIYRLRHRK